MPVSSQSSNRLEAAGYEDVVFDLSSLLTNYPPPFIYIHDPQSIQVTSDIVAGLLGDLSLSSESDARSSSGAGTSTTKICVGRADARACFSQRLLFKRLMHTLIDQEEQDWNDGLPKSDTLTNGELRWNENLDSFLQGLRVARNRLLAEHVQHSNGGGKGKGKEKATQYTDVRLVLLVEHAERLKESMPEMLVPLSRFRELARLDLCVVFVSEIQWSDIKPPLGAAPDPYFIDIPPMTKENAAKIIASRYPTLSSEDPRLYHPALRSLYSHFVAVVCDVCFPYTHNPYELQYIAAARWPGFVQPILEEHQAKLVDAGEDQSDNDIQPPSEDVRLRLTRLFSSTLSNGLEWLYPRRTNASDWARANAPPPDLLSNLPPGGKIIPVNPSSILGTASLLSHLPRLSKFILVGSFLASTNPAKSDLRMFGRGLDDKKRKRKARATTGPKNGVTKVAQRLVGPSPFPLDRLLAILGVLLEEHDADDRLPAPEFSIQGEYTEMEISRIAIYGAVQELASSRLLHRTTKSDQIDGPPMYKSAISYDLVLALSKELKIALSDLLWEQM